MQSNYCIKDKTTFWQNIIELAPLILCYLVNVKLIRNCFTDIFCCSKQKQNKIKTKHIFDWIAILIPCVKELETWDRLSTKTQTETRTRTRTKTETETKTNKHKL